MERSQSAPGIISLTVGIMSLLLCCLGIVGAFTSTIGFILGIIALFYKDKRKECAITGIIINIIACIFSILCILIHPLRLLFYANELHQLQELLDSLTL